MEASVSPDAVRPLRLRSITLESNLVLAPMAGVSNLPFRLIAREAGAALAFTETVSAKGLAMGGARTRRLLRTSPREGIVAFQLFGSEPGVLADACAVLEQEHGAFWIDFNMGCPVKKFIRNGAGSVLLRDPSRAAAIVAAMRRGFSGTLSIKMRSGWDDRSISAPEVARVCVAEGADLVTVHGRTRAQGYRGRVDRTVIRRVVEAVPGTPVLANGDVRRAEQVFDMLRDTGAAGVMIGRASLGNPWIFQQARALASGRAPRRPSVEERLRTLQRHVGLMRQSFEDDAVLAHNLKKYVTAYARGFHGAGEFREQVNRCRQLGEILDRTRRFFEGTRPAA